jgi:hypothetical protein
MLLVPGAPMPPPGIPLPAPPPGLPNGVTPGNGPLPPAQNGTAGNPHQPDVENTAAAPTGSNQSAAQLLRARMRASLKRASPEAPPAEVETPLTEEAPSKKLKTAQDDDVPAAAAAEDAAEAMAAAEPVPVDPQQPAAGDVAAGLDPAAAAIKVEDASASEAVQTEAMETEVKTEAEAQQEHGPDALGGTAADAQAMEPDADESAAAEQLDEPDQADEAAEDDEVWCSLYVLPHIGSGGLAIAVDGVGEPATNVSVLCICAAFTMEGTQLQISPLFKHITTLAGRRGGAVYEGGGG